MGATGTGKTVLAKHLLSGIQRVVVIDPKHTFQLDGFRQITKLPIFGRRQYRLIYRPTSARDADLADLVLELWRDGKTIIYVDELASLSEYYPLTIQALQEIARTGRERQVGLWVAMQRPRWVPRVFLTESEQMAIFALKSKEDRDYVAGLTGEEVKERIPKYKFWYTNSDELDPVLLTYNMETGKIEKASKASSEAERTILQNAVP